MSHIYEALRRLVKQPVDAEPVSESTVSNHSRDFRSESSFEQQHDSDNRQEVGDRPPRSTRLVRSRDLSFAELIAEIARDEEELDY